MNNKQLLIIGIVIVVIASVWWFFSASKNTTQKNLDIVSSETTSDESIKIIAFGDSLTAGYGLSQAEAYPAQLEAALQQKGYEVSVINSGVSGETTRGNLERAEFIRSQDPNIVILGIGGNDALRNLPLEEIKKNIESTVSILKSGEKPPRVILLQMQAPLNSGLKYKQQFDALYKTISIENNLMLIPFITTDMFLNTANKLSDGIHYSKLGYQKVIEKHLLPNLEKILTKD
jgi:acyl-CoA thioesterase-1